MSEQSAVVAEVERRYAEGIELSRRLNDWRVPVVALALSGLLAAATLLALHVWWGWMIVAVLLAGVVLLTVKAGGALRELGRRIIDFRPFPVEVTDADRELLSDFPPYRLEPVLAHRVDQLERMLRPTKQDTVEQSRTIPGQIAAVVLYGLLALVGIVITFLIPTVVVVGDSTLSREPWTVILILAGVPLLALTVHFLRVVDTTREALNEIVEQVERELPRLSASSPRFSSGTVIVDTGGGYAVDRSKLQLQPPSSVMRFARRYGVAALAVLLPLVAALDELSTRYLPAV